MSTTAPLRCRRGLSLVEVLVATLVLGLGVVALVGASANVSGLLGEGRRATRAALLAERRLELLRQQAATRPPCVALAGGSATAPGGLVERWSVAGSGPSRRVTVVVVYAIRGRAHADTVVTAILCRS